MKTYSPFETYLRSVRNLPEIEILLRGNSMTTTLLDTVFSKAAATAFENWYDARTYCCLVPAGVINGYPGDKAAFSLALKAAFFRYRYAWPKLDLDKALEAFARSLPPVEVLDGYQELAHLVSSMQKRKAMRASFMADNPEGDAIQRVLDENPQAQKMLHVIRTLQYKQEAQAEQDAKDIGQDTDLGQCDCPPCRGLRQPADLAEGANPLDEVLKKLPTDLREKLSALRRVIQQRQSPMERLISEAQTLREALNTGKLEEAVSMTLDVMPPEFNVANIQAGLTLVAEQGFGDIVKPYADAVRKHGRFPDFTATPQQGSVDEATYNAILAKIREQLNA